MCSPLAYSLPTTPTELFHLKPRCKIAILVMSVLMLTYLCHERLLQGTVKYKNCSFKTLMKIRTSITPKFAGALWCCRSASPCPKDPQLPVSLEHFPFSFMFKIFFLIMCSLILKTFPCCIIIEQLVTSGGSQDQILAVTSTVLTEVSWFSSDSMYLCGRN